MSEIWNTIYEQYLKTEPMFLGNERVDFSIEEHPDVAEKPWEPLVIGEKGVENSIAVFLLPGIVRYAALGKHGNIDGTMSAVESGKRGKRLVGIDSGGPLYEECLENFNSILKQLASKLGGQYDEGLLFSSAKRLYIGAKIFTKRPHYREEELVDPNDDLLTCVPDHDALLVNIPQCSRYRGEGQYSAMELEEVRAGDFVEVGVTIHGYRIGGKAVIGTNLEHVCVLHRSETPSPSRLRKRVRAPNV